MQIGLVEQVWHLARFLELGKKYILQTTNNK